MTRPRYGQRTPASLLVMALVLLAATPCFADESRAEVYTQAGLSTASLTGTLGRYTSGSIGFVAAQGVLFGAFGFEVSLESEFFLTNQPPPPYTRGLQTFTLALGPRAAWHIAPVVVLGGVEYASIGVASNALVRWTGEIRQTHAIGGHLAARWDLAPPLFVEVRGRWSTWLGVDVPASAFGGVISIGISGALPERGSRR